MGKVFVTETTISLFHNEKEDEEIEEEVDEAFEEKTGNQEEEEKAC